MLLLASLAENCLDAVADATLPPGIIALVLETLAVFGKKYIGQDDATDVVSWEPWGVKLSAAEAGRSAQNTTQQQLNKASTETVTPPHRRGVASGHQSNTMCLGSPPQT